MQTALIVVIVLLRCGLIGVGIYLKSYLQSKAKNLGTHEVQTFSPHSGLATLIGARGWHQHFLGAWARINCESMPVIPAWLVRSNLNDPRRIPYLLVWKDERDGEIKESMRLNSVKMRSTIKQLFYGILISHFIMFQRLARIDRT
jgi:hypothetical protein